jgi:hypothetical protein
VEYGEFFREFSLISAYLLRESRVDQRYVEKWFMLAFGEDTRAKIERRLYVKHPDHHPDDPYKIEDVKAAADFLLQGNIRATVGTAAAESSPGQGATETVKSEPSEMQRLTTQVMALTKAVSTVAQMATQPRMPPASTQASAHAASAADSSTLPPALRLTPFPDPASRPKGCHYCQGPHLMRECAQIKEDLLHCRCKRTAEGKIAFWNGTVITRDYPGTTFADQVKRYNALYPPPTGEPTGATRDPPPHIGANVVDVTDVLYTEAAEEQKDNIGWYDGLDEEELLTAVTVLQNEIARKVERKKGKAVQFAGVEIPARKTQGNTAPKPTDTPPSTEGRSDAKSPGLAGFSGKGKGTAGQGDSGAQYRYQSPIENGEAAKRIMDILMEQQITVSQKDLLAAMPELRKNFKEQVSGKRVPVATSAAYEEAEVYMANYSRLPDGSVVGRDQVPLRCLTVKVNDSEDVECLIDNGCSIIVMHVDVWRRLGLPLTDDIMVMEAANSAKDPTVGRLTNVRFNFQGLEVILQVQVVRNSPCEVLLGRPFFTLTSCVTRDFMDGSQHITITDPNRDDTVTIPTRPRLRRFVGPEGQIAEHTLVAMVDADMGSSEERAIGERPTKRPRLEQSTIHETVARKHESPDLIDLGSSDELGYPDDWQSDQDGPSADSLTERVRDSNPLRVDNIALKAVLKAGLLMGTPYPWDDVAPEARRYFHTDRFSVMEESIDSFLVIDHITGSNYHIDPQRLDDDGFEARDWLIGEQDGGRGEGPDFGLSDLFSREATLESEAPSHAPDDTGLPEGGPGCTSCSMHTHVRVPCPMDKAASSLRPAFLVATPSRRQREVTDANKQPEVIDLTGEEEVIDLTGGSDEESVEPQAFF